MLYKTLGIVLRCFSFGEADKIVTFYTSRFGKIKAVVKGVRKTRSKFGSSMELFTHNNLLLHHKENRELYLVTQTSIVDSFRELRNNLTKLYKTSYIVEIVDSIIKDSEKNQLLFELIITTLSLLKHIDTESDMQKTLRFFEIKFLTITGYKIKLDRCSLCNKEFIGNKYFVSPEKIGILCEKCSQPKSEKLSPESINIIRSIQNIQIKNLEKLEIPHENQIELKKILQNFIIYYAEKEIKSFRFI